MRVENVEEWARANERLFEYHNGHAYAMPPTVQDALSVAIPRNLVASWLFYAEKNSPIFPIRHFVWDIRRLVDGDHAFAEEWLAPVLAEWDDPEKLEALWAEADRPYEDGKDVLVLRALASLYHQEDDEGGLWVLLPDGDEGDPDEVEAIKRLHRLFYELDSAEFDRLEIAAGITNPGEVAGLLARDLLTLTEADLTELSFRDRLRVENEIMMARYEAQPVQPCPVPLPMPLPDHPNLTAQQAIALEDFYACLPAGAFIFTPTRDMWPATSVNSRIGPVAVPMREKPIQASTWLATHRAVEQMTWAPGRPMVIVDKLIADGGWINRSGCSVFNLYRAPTIKPAAGDASPWIDHVKYVFEDEAEHIIRWLAQRVQRPEQKINHALVLGGPQGIGKDTLLEPVKHSIGAWNFTEVSPVQMLGRFNGFVKSVILRISEARDLGDVDRYGFYEHMKTLTAAPPDVLRVDEKHLREHAVVNVCGVIITTNNKDSMHLPPDDRRHFVAWSSRSKDDFKPDYWNALYRWFANGGTEIVAHHLATLDLTDFNPKAPPPKTPAFWEMVDSSRAPEDAEMADALDALGKPDAVTLANILTRAVPSFGEWLQDRRNRRKIPHRFEECGYVAVRNPSAGDGYWVVNGKRAPVYARRELSTRDQIAAAERLSSAGLPMPQLPTR
ncbi:primase-helicase family protein [Bradyrhizobium sp. B025]|uniref:primase-helicase family protein n=1 Tax=Bradyrhizobium sp. B025 TaxID=3344829 RepID=UPI0035D40926